MPNAEPAPSLIRFGVFEVDVRAGEVRKHGYKIKVQDQPFRVLQTLLEHSGRVVTRGELQRAIWPSDTFVDFDRGLNNAIKRLREALGDSAEEPLYIETIPRRGYRFIGSTNGFGRNENPQTHPSTDSAAANARAARAWAFLLPAAIAALVVVTAGVEYWRSKAHEPVSAPELRPIRVVASPAEYPVNYAAISPDGKNIAYVDSAGIHVKVVESGEMRTIPTPTGNPERTGSSGAVQFPIVWYPDGDGLLITTGVPRSTAEAPVIWSVSLVTEIAQKVFEGAWVSAISADGSTIAAVKDEKEIWLMGPHGEEPHEFATAGVDSEIGRVTWSPDGRRLANFRVARKPESLECSLETRSLSDPRPVVLISDSRVCFSQSQSFWWFRDDRIIFPYAEANFDSHDFNMWELRIDSQSGRAVGRPTRLTNWAGSDLMEITGSAEGKRLAFVRTWFRNATTVGDLDPALPGVLAHPRRLANEENNDWWPTTWTDDSRAVVFYTAKNGNNDILKQELGKESPEPVVTGPGEQLTARLSPDGLWFIYMDVPAFVHFGRASTVRLMKVPVSGGAPELVLTSSGYVGHQCSRRPATECVLAERSPETHRLTLSAFDLSGRIASPDGKDSNLFSIEDPDGLYGWAISPDGSLLAVSRRDEQQIRVRFISLRGGPDSEVDVKGWARLDSLHWAADGRSLFISSCTGEACTVLQVDRQGRTYVLSTQPSAYQSWAIPSPDGKHLAVFNAMRNSEVWIAENF